jgi:hypothetical protein
MECRRLDRGVRPDVRALAPLTLGRLFLLVPKRIQLGFVINAKIKKEKKWREEINGK